MGPLLQAAAAQTGSVIRLTDITAASGLRFKHTTGATGRKYLPETLGSGAAIFDADGDGWQDILLLSGTSLAENAPRTGTALRLFRNTGAGNFADVTSKAALDVSMYAMGVAAADFDNDGDQDILVTGVGQSRLFSNGGDGRFTDVTERAGLAGRTGFLYVLDRVTGEPPGVSRRVLTRQRQSRSHCCEPSPAG